VPSHAHRRWSLDAVLVNTRYTGYAFFGWWSKHETLLDPDDMAAGHVVRVFAGPAR
jgi:hypothetical protein